VRNLLQHPVIIPELTLRLRPENLLCRWLRNRDLGSFTRTVWIRLRQTYAAQDCIGLLPVHLAEAIVLCDSLLITSSSAGIALSGHWS
jgi:hypothetical protein